jgi:hypothetical protein
MFSVPEKGPPSVKAIKINETTFLVTWQPLPRDDRNGVITKYEINWQYIQNGPRTKRSVGKPFTVTTQETNFTLYNLKLHEQYQVYVRAFTKVGPGPNSTYSFATSSK